MDRHVGIRLVCALCADIHRQDLRNDNAFNSTQGATFAHPRRRDHSLFVYRYRAVRAGEDAMVLPLRKLPGVLHSVSIAVPVGHVESNGMETYDSNTSRCHGIRCRRYAWGAIRDRSEFLVSTLLSRLTVYYADRLQRSSSLDLWLRPSGILPIPGAYPNKACGKDRVDGPDAAVCVLGDVGRREARERQDLVS